MKNWKDYAIIFFLLLALLIIIKQVFLAIEFSRKPASIDKPVIKRTHKIPVIELDRTPPDLAGIKNPFLPRGKFQTVARIRSQVTTRPIEFKFELTAIVKQGDKPAAMLINENGNSIIVTRGDEVGDVRIAKIGKDYIVISKDGQTKTIKLW